MQGRLDLEIPVTTSFHGQRMLLRTSRCLAWLMATAIACLACGSPSFAQAPPQIHRTLTVTMSEPLTLEVDVPCGEVEILYGRDGQVSISGVAKASAGTKLDSSFFSNALDIEQAGNRVTIRHVPNPAWGEEGVKVFYRIDVPYRTEVTSRLNHGNQTIRGIMGPVRATAGEGDIRASYVSKGLQAHVENGNLDLQVIGEHVEARTGRGNISCVRLEQGISAETGDGDITLMVVGQSTATVKKGNGRIEVGGARGRFAGTTDEGDLHVKAVPHDDWQLQSSSGNIRLDLPPASKFELDVSTVSGKLQVDRDDIAKPAVSVRQLTQVVNGGGKQIQVHTDRGQIVIR
jgi:Putative adhesin